MAEPSNYIARLKGFGINKADSIVQYLDIEEFKLQALYSMLLFSTGTNRLEAESIEAVVSVLKNAGLTEPEFSSERRGSQIKAACVRLLLHNCAESALAASSLRMQAFHFRMRDISQLLADLGELAEADPGNRMTYLRYAEGYLGVAEIFAAGGSPDPPVNWEGAAPLYLKAVSQRLYQEPKMANLAAAVLLKRMTAGGTWRFSELDYRRVVEFLIGQSTCETSFLTEKLLDLSCAPKRIATPLLWILNDQRDKKAVARTVVNRISSQCPANASILTAIQAGQISWALAFEAHSQ